MGLSLDYSVRTGIKVVSEPIILVIDTAGEVYNRPGQWHVLKLNNKKSICNWFVKVIYSK